MGKIVSLLGSFRVCHESISDCYYCLNMNAGGVVDVSKGREKYNFDSSYPVTVRKRFYNDPCLLVSLIVQLSLENLHFKWHLRIIEVIQTYSDNFS